MVDLYFQILSFALFYKIIQTTICETSTVFSNVHFILQCSRHTKLEKADILELTVISDHAHRQWCSVDKTFTLSQVQHLKTLQRQQMAAAVSSDPSVLNKFKSGFSECAGEISRYLTTIDGVDKNVRQRLLTHLATCLSGLHSYLSPIAFPAMHSNFPGPQFYPAGSPPHLQAMMQKEGALRNVPGGLIMLPTRDQYSMHSLRGAQHFFPASASPLNSMPLSELNSCSSPSYSAPSTPGSLFSMSCNASLPTTPSSPSSLCSKITDVSDPVWRPW